MYQKIYDQLNSRFFDETLNRPIFLLGRHKEDIGGYYIPSAWTDSNDAKKQYGELCLNVNLLQYERLGQIIMVLFHEMMHQAQYQENPDRPRAKHDNSFVEFGEMNGLKTIIWSNDTSVATGEIIPGGLLDQFITEYALEVTPEDFIPATPNKVLTIDPKTAAQPMPSGPGEPLPDAPEGQEQRQGGGAQGESQGGSQGAGPTGPPGDGDQGQGGPATAQGRAEGGGKANPNMTCSYVCPAGGERVIGEHGLKMNCLQHSCRMVECRE